MLLSKIFPETPNTSVPLPWLLTCGQPTEADLRAAGEAGIGTVIDLRDPMEPRPFDEPDVLAECGIAYQNIPVNSGALDDATLERVLVALRSADRKPTVLHCASANRVAGALVAWFILDEGMTEQEATAAAMRIGLRSAELLEWGMRYARSHGAG